MRARTRQSDISEKLDELRQEMAAMQKELIAIRKVIKRSLDEYHEDLVDVHLLIKAKRPSRQIERQPEQTPTLPNESCVDSSVPRPD